MELAAWLRLTLVPGVGGEARRALLKAFGLPEAIFSAGPGELSACRRCPDRRAPAAP
jgi:predicted Rossmann fold nucleotide-binding protein DprA/Smf involved in DNA uptake